MSLLDSKIYKYCKIQKRENQLFWIYIFKKKKVQRLILNCLPRDMEKNNISEIHEDAFLPLNNLKDLWVTFSTFNAITNSSITLLVIGFRAKSIFLPPETSGRTASQCCHPRVWRRSWSWKLTIILPSRISPPLRWLVIDDRIFFIIFPHEKYFRVFRTSGWWDQATLTTAVNSCPPPMKTWSIPSSSSTFCCCY